MRKLIDLLRLHFVMQLSCRAIAAALSINRSTVLRTLRRFLQAGLTWPLPAAITEAQLEALLFRSEAHRGVISSAPRPDYAQIASELKRKGVTRRLLWDEYRQANADGIGYSLFCAELAAHQQHGDVSYRHDHVPGERAYFDFAGMTLRVRDGDNVVDAQIFAAALGYSNFLYAIATADQTTAAWLLGQSLALEAFGGSPQIGVPDNPRALVTRPCRYEPDINVAYQRFATHYSMAIIPARVRKPKDKSPVEGGVKVIEQRVLAQARDRIFESFIELNQWLVEQVEKVNAAAFQKRAGSRAQLLLEERPHLRRYEHAREKLAKVSRDYHVQIGQRLYSVPHIHCGQEITLRIGAHTVKMYLRDQRIAVHLLSGKDRFSTVPEHMPERHRAWRDQRLQHQALAIGPHTCALIDALYLARRHPEQVMRSAQGVLRLSKDYPDVAIEVACETALRLGALSYSSVMRLLKHPLPVTEPLPLPMPHDNLRGADYYSRTVEVSHAA